MPNPVRALVDELAEQFATMNDFIAEGDWEEARQVNNEATTIALKLPQGSAIRAEAFNSLIELTQLITRQESAAAGTVTARIIQFLRNAEFDEIQEAARVGRAFLPDALNPDFRPENDGNGGFLFGLGAVAAAVAVTAVVGLSVIATIKILR